MTVIERSALLPHTADQVFDLVADIERYPEFLEGCVGAEIHERGEETVTATLRLYRAGIIHGFTTCNMMTRPEKIELTLVDGPFDSFSGQWMFRALGEAACKTSLRLDFELTSGVADLAAAKLFDKVALDLVDAVVRRANQELGAAT